MSAALPTVENVLIAPRWNVAELVRLRRTGLTQLGPARLDERGLWTFGLATFAPDQLAALIEGHEVVAAPRAYWEAHPAA